MRALRKQKVGIVVSDKMDKSVVVEVKRKVKHPRYGKFIGRTSRFMAHDAENKSHIGDTVRIMETRPLSRRKRWYLAEILLSSK
ncbi:MAG: 30S ribosomal protein S17 [Cytophagales bacterium]|nr:30S ribosomal protein S17 [Cytophagales bacterium]